MYVPAAIFTREGGLVIERCMSDATSSSLGMIVFRILTVLLMIVMLSHFCTPTSR